MGAEDSFIPVYYRLEKFLRDQIRTGALKPSDAVPPESQLAQQFSVSRMTVRQALSRLVFEGLIVRHRGRGSFVAEPRLEYTKMFWSFEEEMQARGSRTAHKLLDMRSVKAEGKVADNLALSEGTLVTRLERQRFVDGQLIGYEIRYLPRHIGEALTQDEIHNQPLVPAVKRILGRGPTRISLRLDLLGRSPGGGQDPGDESRRACVDPRAHLVRGTQRAGPVRQVHLPRRPLPDVCRVHLGPARANPWTLRSHACPFDSALTNVCRCPASGSSPARFWEWLVCQRKRRRSSPTFWWRRTAGGGGVPIEEAALRELEALGRRLGVSW